MAKGHKRSFKFKKHMQCGAPDAEHDEFRESAFISTNELPVALNKEDHRGLVIGRTGTGKSALLMKVEDSWGPDHCLRINPEVLGMQFVSNSTIIPELSAAGVNLTFFYKLLWRHVLFVELVNKRWGLDDAPNRAVFSRVLERIMRDTKKARCFKYFQDFGTTFFDHAEEVVKNVVHRFEKEVGSSMGGGVSSPVSSLKASLTARAGSSSEESKKIKQKAQKVVDDVQMRELSNALYILRDDVMDDAQKNIFVLIDDLDKNWVDISYQYNLIDALIQEMREFSTKVPNVKIVVALREDILQKLLRRQERHPLQQREKYHSVTLHIDWSVEELTCLARRRIERLSSVDGEAVTLDQILPGPRKGENAFDYILKRTWYRPRDVIQFLNCCIHESIGRTKITWKQLDAAESSYSADRCLSISEEWGETYPGVRVLIDSLRMIQNGFTVEDFDEDRLEQILIQGEHDESPRSETTYLWKLFDNGADPMQLRQHVLGVLYQIGAVGVKATPQDPYCYVSERPNLIDSGLTEECRMEVHPGLWRALGIRPTGGR